MQQVLLTTISSPPLQLTLYQMILPIKTTFLTLIQPLVNLLALIINLLT
jgi:hypothetical protein